MVPLLGNAILGARMTKTSRLLLALFSLFALSAANAVFAETWVHVNNASIRMALNGREVVFTNEGNQQIGGRQSWTSDGTTITASDRVGIWIARNREYCSKRADKGQPLPANWDCFEFAISQDGKKMRFGSGDYTWVGEFVK